MKQGERTLDLQKQLKGSFFFKQVEIILPQTTIQELYTMLSIGQYLPVFPPFKPIFFQSRRT